MWTIRMSGRLTRPARDHLPAACAGFAAGQLQSLAGGRTGGVARIRVAVRSMSSTFMPTHNAPPTYFTQPAVAASSSAVSHIARVNLSLETSSKSVTLCETCIMCMASRGSNFCCKPNKSSIKPYSTLAPFLGSRGTSSHSFPMHHHPTSNNQIFKCHYSTQSNKGKIFKVLEGDVETESATFQENDHHSKAIVEGYLSVYSVAVGGGGEKARDRHTVKNKKILVEDRLRLLFDESSEVLEVGTLAGIGMPYGNIPRAGIVAAIGKIHGVYCMALANDATVKAGTLYPVGVDKQLRGQQICMDNHIPCIYVVDSGGAFLPLQAEIFPDKEHGGRVFRNEAILNSMGIPQLAIVCGSCTAGGAYVPTMVQESVIVHKVGTIFLGGPPLVKAALGEVVSAEALGGATMHCSTSGCTDHFAETEDQAFSISRDVAATFNVEPSLEPEATEQPLYDPDELLGIIPKVNQHTMDMYKVLARIVDGSRFQEFKVKFGSTLVAGFAHIQGYLVGIVASNGELTRAAALKGSHFVQMCDQRNIPLVFLQNTTPDAAMATTVDQGEVVGTQTTAHASMMGAVACARVPKLTVVVGNSIGPESYVMCGRSFAPRFMFCWPNARFSITDPSFLVEGAVKLKQQTSSDTSGDDLEQHRAKVTKLIQQQTSATYSSSRGWNDGVILPQDTRKVLGQCLAIIQQGDRARSSRQEPTRMSVLRL